LENVRVKRPAIGVSCRPGASDVSVRDRLIGIDTNLDDLQSGVEAGSREADRIQKTATRFERLERRSLESAHLLGTMARHVKDLQLCMRDQRAAMDELRATVVGRPPRQKDSTGAGR